MIHYEPHEAQSKIHQSKKRFRVVVAGRRFGKTLLACIEMIIFALEKNKARVWYVSPTYKQSKTICFNMLKDLIPAELVKKVNISDLSFELFNGSEIALKGADQEDALKGVGLDFVVMDEFASMRRNAWFEEIRPTLSDTGGSALFIGTPKGRNHFFDLFVKEDPEWESFRFNTSENPYIPPKEIEQVKKDLSERLFRQEYGSEFLEDDVGVFKGVRRCIVGELQKPILGRLYVMGVDLAKSIDYTVLTVMDTVTREVVAHQRFQDMSWRDQTLKIQHLAREYNNAMCVVDSTGVGDPVFEDLVSIGVSADPYKFTTNTAKVQLIEQLQIAIERRQITFPDIEVLFIAYTKP